MLPKSLPHLMLVAGLVAGIGLGAAASPRVAELLRPMAAPAMLTEFPACQKPSGQPDGIGRLILQDEARRRGLSRA